MHVLLTADPYIPVPPVHYGGIERIIDFHVRELLRRGHEVTLVAHPDSRTGASLVPYGHPPHTGTLARAQELAAVAGAVWRRRRQADIVHSFGRLAALLPVLPLRHVPKVQSYQREVPWTGVSRAARLAGRSLVFTSCSTSLAQARRPEDGEWRTVFNSVDPSKYTPVAAVAADAPLVFLGRLDPIKGAHHAIAIAAGAGRRLVIAGNRLTDGPDVGYYDARIAPHVDGDGVRYVGPVDDTQKNELLGSAAALLMPIDWDEPFGIVMAEALACGTPVVGFARGSVPEVVRHGVTGFVCRSVDEAVAAVGRLGRIDRRTVRADCEERFSGLAMTDAYQALYGELIGRVGQSPAARPTA